MDEEKRRQARELYVKCKYLADSKYLLQDALESVTQTNLNCLRAEKFELVNKASKIQQDIMDLQELIDEEANNLFDEALDIEDSDD